MATAIVLSAVFLQSKPGNRLASKPFVPRPSCHKNGLLCRSSQYAPLPAPKRTSSRRDSIALFMQIALLCAPTAHAAESVHLKGELKMEDSSDDRQGQMLMSNLHLGELSGLVLARASPSETSKNSLGFLGCLVLGLLFWREKQANAANAASLEDVQLCIKKAETELTSQTRRLIGYKLQESQLNIGSELDISQHETLQYQLSSIKSNIVERGKRLTANIHFSETLKQQITSLTTSVEEAKSDCISLMANVERKTRCRQGLEVEIQCVKTNLQEKAKEIGSLKVVMAEQKQACNKLVGENDAVESSLDMIDEKVLMLETEIESLESSLRVSNDAAGFLSKELNTAVIRNESLEVELSELLSILQHERASSEKIIAEHHELLAFKEKEAHALSTKLISQQDELDREFKVISQLTNEQCELEKVLREKKRNLKKLREALSLDLKRLRMLESEIPSVHQQLQNEQARNVSLDLAQKDNTSLRELLDISAKLEGQISKEKELSERLEQELHSAQEALSLKKIEVLDFQKSIQSILSSQAHLQDELTKVHELQQSLVQAQKKEKRAAAYAKRQLPLTRNKLAGENLVLDGLRDELEKVRELNEDYRSQVLLQSNQLETASGTAARLSDDVVALRAALMKEQTEQIQFTEVDEISPFVAKPSHRRGISKPGMQKSRKNSGYF